MNRLAKQKPPTAAPGRRLLDMKEAAARIGCSWWTVRDKVASGEYASHKIGRLVRLSDAEVDRIIAESERPRVA